MIKKEKAKKMKIQDYKILTGRRNAYIARTSKRSGIMLEPSRPIPEDEILNLIAWWLWQKLEGTTSKSHFITLDGKPIIELKRLKKYDI